MHSALIEPNKQMISCIWPWQRKKLNAIDIIVQVRGARVFITTVDPELNATTNAFNPGLIVFAKRDLVKFNMQLLVQAHFKTYHQIAGNNESSPRSSIFTSTQDQLHPATV